MATKMATNLLQHLLVLALAFQWSSLDARGLPEDYYDTLQDTTTGEYYPEFSRNVVTPSDYDTQGDAYQADLEFPDAPLIFDTESELPSFAEETGAWGYPANENDGWESFATQDNVPFIPSEAEEYGTFPSTESELPYGTHEDSAAITEPTIIFADDTAHAYVEPTGHNHTQVVYEDEEAYFDTSGADTIYGANDDGLSLSAANVMNATGTDDMLASLANAMGGCGTGNPIDDCWRCDPNWPSHRKALAACVTGFGRSALGGKDGPFYVVTNNSDDAVNPGPGTLRYGLTRIGPLWIIFNESMTIRPVAELWVTAFKTIDGRGAEIHIVGAQVSIQAVSNVIVHGIHIHDILVTGPTKIRVSPSKVQSRGKSEGDALHIFNSKNVWVDHCYLANAVDGLLDATRGSTMITVSNNLFENHNKVMLFGSTPKDIQDRGMKATVAYNRFGRGLVQRMPRCRYGVFHVVNNHYPEGWALYAIGGSEDPMILSQGNFFNAGVKKDVTKHVDDGGPTFGGWQKWNWASSDDIFRNGAYFTGSGAKATRANVYAKAYSTSPRPAALVPALTSDAGPIIFKDLPSR